MAKIYIEGNFPKRIENFVLYRWGSKVVIKMISGFTSEALLNEPQYELSRNNANEFGRVSSLCKQLRVALSGILPKQNNLAVVNSLTKKMRAVLEHDTTNKRGGRQLANALATENGRDLLKGYEFNPDTVITLGYLLTGGSLTVTAKDTKFPKGVSHIGFRVHRLVFDFASGENQLVSGEWVIGSGNVDLALPPLSDRNGVVFMILEAAFYGYVDGGFLAMDGDGGKSVVVVGIG